MTEDNKKFIMDVLKENYGIKDEKILFHKLIRERLKELHEAKKDSN